MNPYINTLNYLVNAIITVEKLINYVNEFKSLDDYLKTVYCYSHNYNH